MADAHGLLVAASDIDSSLRVSREVKVSPRVFRSITANISVLVSKGAWTRPSRFGLRQWGPRNRILVRPRLYLGDASEHISSELAAEITRLDWNGPSRSRG